MHRPLFRRRPMACALAAMSLALPLHAAEFVFEGELQDGGAPANGLYDLQLTPYVDMQSALPLGAPSEFPLVEVIDGRFRVSLDLPGHIEAPVLAVAVRDGGAKSAYSPLPGRQQAKAGQIGVCWSTTGDEGAVAGTHFIGTTDKTTFEMRAGAAPVLRLIPTGGAPNILAGNSGNSIAGSSTVASVIGGGGNAINPNLIEDSFATISGGSGNRVSAASGTIAGGFSNRVSAIGGAVLGGFGNRAEGGSSVVGGGEQNLASGQYASVSGGFQNVAGGGRAAVGGGLWNDTPGRFGTAPGGSENCAGGELSFAAGFRAKVRRGADSTAETGLGCAGVPTTAGVDGDAGTFVWADSGLADFVSTGPDQFLVRASGGFALNSNVVPGSTDLFVNSRSNAANADLLLKARGASDGINFGATSNGTLFIARADVSNAAVPVYTDYAQWSSTGQFRLYFDNPIKPTGGGFSAPSDARLKQHIAPLTDSLNRLLALRGTTFEYLPTAPKGFYTPGMQTGFIAQEVEKVFPEWVSTDASGYKLVGIKGFEALAVEALRELRQEKDAEIETLQLQLDEQREANAALEARLERLEAALTDRVR